MVNAVRKIIIDIISANIHVSSYKQSSAAENVTIFCKTAETIIAICSKSVYIHHGAKFSIYMYVLYTWRELKN